MMDRSREARRAAGMVASSNGLSRRRHRSNSLRDSPDEDGPVELQESVRLRERVKKDRDRDRDRERDRERDRDRDRERERERERERSSRSSKRRRGERLMIHGSTRDDAGDDTSEESVNDDEEDEDEDNNHSNNNGHHTGGGIGGGVRLLPPNPNAGSAAASSISNHYHSSSSNNHHHHNNSNNHNHHHQHLQHRKSFPPSAGAAKVFRAAPVWKSGDEMIGVSVPRKARSASIKRSHDWMSNSTGGNSGVVVGGVGVEQIHRQASTSPVRQNIVSTPTPPPPPAAPMSPSSSNASARKKIKPNGPKQPRPPKSSSKASSSNPEELEIEIAEVLSGLKTQSQAPPKKEILSNDSTEVNRSSSDAKSRVSSPISNSPSTNIQSSPAILPPNSCSSAGPLSAIAAPKRKRPRQVSESPGGYSVRSSPISSTAKMEIDQTPKADVSSPNLEKAPGSEAENGYDLGNLVNSQGSPPELPLPELLKADSELKPAAEGLGESRDVIPKEELICSPKEESPAVRAEESNRDDAATATALASVTKASSAVPEVDAQREKFQIDLEAPPPQLRSSPERESEIFSMASAVDHKPVVSEELKPVLAKDKEDERVVKMGKEAAVTVGADEMKVKLAVEESESQKRGENKVRNIDLQLDLEKPERDTGMSSRLPPQGVKQQQQLQPSKAAKEEPHGEKTGHPSSLPLPMSMASWPGGLPPMGYMAPIQGGVVSMDGSTVSPAPIQPFFSQPRPKRCATHCYIARNIHYLQQLMKMNPFWPPAAAAASSASLFGSKPLSVVPPADLQGNIAGRAVNSAQDKAQGLAIFPGHGGKDKSSQPANIADASQRKQQILLQQALPPVAPNNILHGPAFIFPLNQQPAAVAAASARPGSIKPPASSSNLASTSASNTAASSASATAGGGAAAVSFNYPNMTANETQYLAILQNNAYPFPIPAAVGAPPNYRGTHPQALPMFNGSFYSSQIIHPSQLQQPQQPVSQSQQMQQNHQNPSVSSGSSSSQKHLQSQQQRPAGSAVGGGNGSGNLHNFPAPKNRQSQQSQQPHNQQITPSQARQLENEVGAEDSPSTADSRGARGPMNIYGQNFAMPMHPQNYALLATPAALANATATTGSSNQSEKKHQQAQQQGKNGVESLPPQTFAMSFASINGASSAPGIDLSSMAQNHAILQSLPEATRHNIQIMAATAAAQAAHRKNFRMSEDGKAGGVDSSNTEDERKGLSGKSPATTSQSIAFSRSELTDASGSATAANNVIDSSARSLNLASGPAWTARSTMPNSVGAASVSNAQLQAQHQPQQMMQLHKQQQLAAASGARNKTPATSNGSVYPDHLSSASSMAKFPNSLSGFPQNLVQTSNSSSPAQSPQWKNSARTNTSQASSSFVTSTTSSLKSLPQQQGRTQQSHTQISFGANQKASASPQGQQAPSSIQSPSSPMMVGSPSTSSISKGTGGSPRTSASASSKTGQAASLSSQQAKNSSHPGQKSSPVSGRNVPSILGNPHVASTSNSGPKSQMQQQQQQQHQQLPKNMQQAQLFFSNPYMQSQSQHSTNTNATTASGGYYIQRRRPDQQQQPPGTSAGSSTGMLTLCPVSLAGAGTSDPAKAIAAATVAASNMKGGGLPSQSILHAAQFAAQSAGNQHQLLPTGFPYVHPVPAAVQVKPAEQKQPAGNDNLHACWQPEKK